MKKERALFKTFLLTLSKECRNNVEYMEYSNEVLFTTLSKKTEVVMDLVQSEKEIDKDGNVAFMA